MLAHRNTRVSQHGRFTWLFPETSQTDARTLETLAHCGPQCPPLAPRYSNKRETKRNQLPYLDEHMKNIEGFSLYNNRFDLISPDILLCFPFSPPSSCPSLSLLRLFHPHLLVSLPSNLSSPSCLLVPYLSRFHSFTDPSAAHEAKLTSDWSRDIPACGRKTTAPTLVLCPFANQRMWTERGRSQSIKRCLHFSQRNSIWSGVRLC